jgi:hypothetical protein
MKKKDSFRYNVRVGEKIVFNVTPRNFNDSLFSVNAVRDGATFEPEPGSDNAPQFEFTVSKPVHDIHTVIMEFTFIQGSPENAVYEVVIAGQNDEGCPCGFTIKKTSGNKEPGIEFFVVA